MAADIASASEPNKVSAGIRATARVEHPAGITSLNSFDDSKIPSKQMIHFPNRDGWIVEVDDGRGGVDQYSMHNIESLSRLFIPGPSDRTMVLDAKNLSRNTASQIPVIITILNCDI